MDERISGRQKLFLIAKEARIGLVNGLILGSLSVVWYYGLAWVLLIRVLHL